VLPIKPPPLELPLSSSAPQLTESTSGDSGGSSLRLVSSPCSLHSGASAWCSYQR